MNGIRLALSFLTSVPMRTDAPQAGDLGRAAMWFPLIGFGLGLGLALAHLVFGLLFPSLLAAALTVALWAALTGGLHLDGLADCCDGLLATATPERRLDIMRDPRLGAFGVIGLTLFIVLKILAVASLLPLPFFLLPFTSSISRWLIVPAALQRPARPQGMGADFARGLTPPVVALTALVPLAWIVIGLIYRLWPVLISIALVHLVTLGMIALAHARLGGVTGDIFGLIVELSELTALLTFAALIPAPLGA